MPQDNMSEDEFRQKIEKVDEENFEIDTGDSDSDGVKLDGEAADPYAEESDE